MSFDIFGQPLKRGHCEVHPHVNEEWPCSLCLMESEQRRRTESNDNAQHDMILEVEHLKMQRAELLAALELAESAYRLNVITDGEPSSILDAMQRVIAKAKAGAEIHSLDAWKMDEPEGWHGPLAWAVVVDGKVWRLSLNQPIATGEHKDASFLPLYAASAPNPQGGAV